MQNKPVYTIFRLSDRIFFFVYYISFCGIKRQVASKSQYLHILLFTSRVLCFVFLPLSNFYFMKIQPTHCEALLNNMWFLYPLQTQFGGGGGLQESACMFVCPSVHLSGPTSTSFVRFPPNFVEFKIMMCELCSIKDFIVH